MDNLSQSSPAKDIKVTLLLMGGHHYTISVKSDSPLLVNLLRTVAAQTQSQSTGSSKLFQLPVNDDRQALWFSSHHLVGVVTEPPIFAQPQPQSVPTLEQPTTSQFVQYATPKPPAPDPIISSDFIQLEQFLTPAETNRLIKYVLKNERNFVPTSTSTGEADYRKSMVLHSFPEFSQLMIKRIKEVTPEILTRLEIPQFNISDVECQLTLHNDGNYYKVHNDSGSADTLTRELTYVYYFNRQPKAFSGGELVIYDSKVVNNYYVAAETYKVVEPHHNSVVFFPSRYMHEVLPVSVPSRAFMDSRFTINGWVRRAT
ncbi:2OG-Fe(II) oxygenase [Desertifilum sp. FACHB-1129]|uniref:Proline hydroxylase n=1 Tax=Desertifilum tharense IPPAS B-1220 TaxID=1781255 RepID=A0A1E5QEF8_9CYAN|nr:MULTISPECIES: 2OG-Fe(II) oxygenase [Desertifilum]MDA0211893.1 2OG-Fe(II) oxygenase [Cyanobacteria bacterium FC1]MBD2314263.1 2OG-Fe(II) oxygenase [Desertifilum sp. FACHB-1129]MBD2320366.1 2OG-Fe(II) oxygenase [Desertifilum sp. FACHB-866]MBD2330494.1 2OG-Fe(II) oxygenase [Desertifilum sp. FACHB-868]OEJ72974.1 proline hydroxylase [Desertifilum tharense IPPAS B-1220]